MKKQKRGEKSAILICNKAKILQEELVSKVTYTDVKQNLVEEGSLCPLPELLKVAQPRLVVYQIAAGGVRGAPAVSLSHKTDIFVQTLRELVERVCEPLMLHFDV